MMKMQEDVISSLPPLLAHGSADILQSVREASRSDSTVLRKSMYVSTLVVRACPLPCPSQSPI